MNVVADQYAVMGNPIEHSKSPAIHAMFAAQTGEKLRYEPMLVPVDSFTAAVNQFFEDKGKGLNITVPFKQEAWELVDQLTGRARRAGAVNTLWQKDGALWGDTTDGVGLVRDITKNYKLDIVGKKVLILGAGGAVRGVLEPLLEQQPAQVVIANRTVSRAEELAVVFSEFGSISACSFDDARGPFDLIINGTSASLHGECLLLPESAIASKTVVYDMMYGAGETVFNQWARTQGARMAVDGLGMLVEQAAESFSIWRGVRPESEQIINKLRSELV